MHRALCDARIIIHIALSTSLANIVEPGKLPSLVLSSLFDLFKQKTSAGSSVTFYKLGNLLKLRLA